MILELSIGVMAHGVWFKVSELYFLGNYIEILDISLKIQCIIHYFPEIHEMSRQTCLIRDVKA